MADTTLSGSSAAAPASGGTTADSFQQAQTASAQTCSDNVAPNGNVLPCGAVVSKKKVGLVLAAYPVLFKKDESPTKYDDFKPIKDSEKEFGYQLFKDFDYHLFADGRSEAIIEVFLVKLNEQGKVPGTEVTAAPNDDHKGEGTVVVKCSNTNGGCLKCGEQEGQKIEFKVADLKDGCSPVEKGDPKAIKFVAANAIGDVEIKASIEGNTSYEYTTDFELPQNYKKGFVIKTGTRQIGPKTKGYDVRKYQWYLRQFGFLDYDFDKTIKDDESGNDWKDIKELDMNGEWRDDKRSTTRASRDFQLVAKGAFRNQQNLKVDVTLTENVSDSIGDKQAGECAKWYDKDNDKPKYKVDPYHGLVLRKHKLDDTQINERATIIYGALIKDEATNHGYVQVGNPVGKTKCHWDDKEIQISESIRSAIRLFNKDKLIFRLHDADPNAILEDNKVNSKFKERVTKALCKMRELQEGDYSDAKRRDVLINEGYRSTSDQNNAYAKGRTAKNDGSTCTHELCKHDEGWQQKCYCDAHKNKTKAELGDNYKVVTFKAGECTWRIEPNWSFKKDWSDAQHQANGMTVTSATGGESWHQYGLAVDIIFYSLDGGKQWPTTPYGKLDEIAGQEESKLTPLAAERCHYQMFAADAPTADDRGKYNSAAGDEKAKLEAVWSNRGVA